MSYLKIMKWSNIIILVLFGHFVSAQTITGKVIDATTKEPLAFVNVVLNTQQQAVFTDLDGNFQINTKAVHVVFLEFSYIGYKTQKIETWDNSKPLEIKLSPKDYHIAEVTILPGENPAHPIIRKATQNKSKHRPENLASFSYRSYSKMYFTLEMPDSLKSKNIALTDTSTRADSSMVGMLNFFNRQYLFMAESVSKRIYKKPGQSYEKILASRTSGFKQPVFTMIATEMQSFSFYDNTITLAEKNYVNPLSAGATARYFFNLEDTLVNQKGDSIFVISFRPKKNKTFDALEGVMHINNDGYALQTITAKPAKGKNLIEYQIEQKYEKIGGKNWFPIQLHAKIIMSSVNASAGEITLPITGISRTYIDSIKIEVPLKNKDFQMNGVEQINTLRPDADKILNTHRIMPLTAKELKTFEVLDSVGKAEKLDQKINTVKAIATGYYPIGKFEIDYLSVLDFNEYEKYRIGLGGRTSDLLSKKISVNGFFAYGTRDKRWKYGAGILLKPKIESKIMFFAKHQRDVVEMGGLNMRMHSTDFSGSEMLRDYLIDQMNLVEETGAGVFLDLRRNIRLQLGFYKQNIYHLGYDIAQQSPTWRQNENHLALRWSPGEKRVKSFLGEYEQESKWPVFVLDIKTAIESEMKETLYSKIAASANYTFRTSFFGETSVNILSAYIDKAVPSYLLYNGRGSYYDFTIETANSFGSMRIGEFWADRFVSVFWQHHFNFALFKWKKVRPRPALVANLGFGELHNKNMEAENLKDFSKGFAEAGLQLNSLYSQLGLIHYGFGVYYRLGYYSFETPKENFAYKLTLQFRF